VEHLRVDLHRPRRSDNHIDLGDSLLTNTENVGEALLNLPGSVITDIGTEVQNLFADVAGGEAFTTAFDATILGLV